MSRQKIVIKVTLSGNAAVGKTSLRNRFIGRSIPYAAVQTVGSIVRQERNTLLHGTGHIFIECWESCEELHHGNDVIWTSSPYCGFINWGTAGNIV